MIATLVVVTAKNPGVNFTLEFAIGAIVALFILGYLVYSLIKPEKF